MTALYFITIITWLVICGAVIVRLLMKWQGEAVFVFSVAERGPWRLQAKDEREMIIAAAFPFSNQGRQDGTLIDVFPRVQLPEEQYDLARIRARLYWQEKSRTDDYWECFIFPKGFRGWLVLEITVTARDGTLSAACRQLPDFPVDIYYQAVSRTDYYINKVRMIIGAGDIRQLAAGVADRSEKQ
ncbi:MAG: hypothetical protein N3A57_06415 [Negativicutes bacterium]|nr:hypothetical protein [Negativicutes bacterium]